MKELVIKLSKTDNVLVALQNLPKATALVFEGKIYEMQDDILAKHKFFMHDMQAGDEVIMYSVLVGKVQYAVKKGMRMTVENTKHAAESYSYKGKKLVWEAPNIDRFVNQHFNGYHRKNGEVGTANYWLFIPTVFCENRNLDIIKESLYNALGYAVDHQYKTYTQKLIDAYQNGDDIDQISFEPKSKLASDRIFKNVDGIKFLNHNGGCGGTRQDSQMLCNLLAAYADHSNVAGITLLSLGCQHLQVTNFKNELYRRNPNFDKPLFIFEQQATFSEEELIHEAIKQTFKGLVEVNRQERAPAPLSKLCVGVKCGGSDGFSGISANPAVGHCADLLVALGAKVLAAEFPELCGVEQEIIDRCVDEQTAHKFIHLMEAYDKLAHQAGSGFYMNPSPGNIKDGLITDAIKSAGAAKKAGSSAVVDVLDYTEPATKPGLSMVCTPGNDVEATTGKAAAGATLILFTTGLGTPTGNPICPTIKVATNTNLATRMSDIIDIDCGPIINGEKSIAQMGEDILSYCIKVASGEEIPKAVQLNQDDFIPWKRGVSL